VTLLRHIIAQHFHKIDIKIIHYINNTIYIMSKIIDDEDFVSVSSEEEEDDIYDDEIEDDEDDEDDEDEVVVNNVAESYDIEYEEAVVDEDDEDVVVKDDEPIEYYLQKLNDQIKSNIIGEYHPQLKPHNYEEIQLLTKIKRNENGDIIDDLHKTTPIMTKYEKSRILAERTVQLNLGMHTFLDNEQPDIIDGYLIALQEFKEKKIPFIVKRPLPNGAFEYWNACDLEIL
jgi:DNA-directed RNA polymerase subunit K/omega